MQRSTPTIDTKPRTLSEDETLALRVLLFSSVLLISSALLVIGASFHKDQYTENEK